MLRKVVSTLFPQDLSVLGVKASTTWNMSVLRISRALGRVRHLPEEDSNNKDDGILNAFTATVNPTDGIVEDVDEEEKLMECKFEKMDNQDDIHTTY